MNDDVNFNLGAIVASLSASFKGFFYLADRNFIRICTK